MVAPEILERAKHPDLRVGRGLLDRELVLPGRVALLTQAGPLGALPPSLAARFDPVLMVASLAAPSLEAMDAGLPQLDGVVGVGGGTAIDAAKYLAWRRSIPLVLAPSVISVDAVVTNNIAVRRGDQIVPEGFVVADRIVADLGLITTAPARLNRAGIGDLVSIQTALFDWRLASRSGQPRSLVWDGAIAGRAKDVLERLYALADEVRGVTDGALEAVLRGYAEVNELCLSAGHGGPEEGSEHYLGYRLELLSGRSFVHGELIGLATVLMARLQGNDPARVEAFLDRCGVAWRPAAQGLGRDLLVEALTGLGAFAARARLPRTIADERAVDEDLAARLIAGL